MKALLLRDLRLALRVGGGFGLATRTTRIVCGIATRASPPTRSAGMNDCVSRVCVIMGWEWDGIGIGMAIPGGAACVAGIGDPNPKT